VVTKITRRLARRAINLQEHLKWRYGKDSHESVCFYTFHKCASSLFSGYVLKNIEGLRHVDYADQIYSGKKLDDLNFEKTGFIYGPIRLSADPQSLVFKKLVEPASHSDFIRDRIAIFFVRDPRDILVSSYYSFGFTHGLSPIDEIREMQEKARSEIQSKTLDEYVLEAAGGILSNFETVAMLSKVCNRSVVLRYEDMLSDWDRFAQDLTKYVSIKQPVLTQIYEQSRPRDEEDVTSHRRSGKARGFEKKLERATIDSINVLFEDVLKRFRYDV